MTSKAARLNIKRAVRAGRPRKDGERYPSGDRKQAEIEKEALSVGVEARGRVYGLKTKDPRVGYLLGRLNLQGKISDDQLEAGNEFALAIGHYHAATGIPFPSARAQNIFKIAGMDGEVTESMADRARRASNKMMALRGVLLQTIDGPQVSSTVWSVCVMDYDHMLSMPDQQMLWLKRGLSALDRHYDLIRHGKSSKAFG